MNAQVTIGNGNIIRETAKAILFDFDERETWMPKSQIEIEIDRNNPSALGTVTMPIWLAKDRGLWGYDCYGQGICELVD